MLRLKYVLMIVGVTLVGMFCMSFGSMQIHAAQNNVYDLSEWQGKFTDDQVKKLKDEVPFVILRVQYGTRHYDKTFNHNKAMLEKYGVPYGVYSYSRYTSNASAAREARDLYYRAPNAKFYVNDFESTHLGRSTARAATLKWVQTLRPLVGNKKILFYSYQSFMKTYAKSALSSYDGYWLAAYTRHEPSVSHVLWQYTDRYYSAALNKKVDASKMRQDQSWFIGDVIVKANNSTNSTPTTQVQSQPSAPTTTTTTSTNTSSSSTPAIQKMDTKVMTIAANAMDSIYGDNQATLPVDNTINYQGKQFAIVAQSKYNGKTYYEATSVYSGGVVGWIPADAFNK